MADSIYYGSFFALISLSLSLLFGVMGLMNFAYGELIMAGAYVMFYTRSWGWLAMVVMVDPDRHGPVAPDGADRVPPAAPRRAGGAPDHLVRGQLRARGGWAG